MLSVPGGYASPDGQDRTMEGPDADHDPARREFNSLSTEVSALGTAIDALRMSIEQGYPAG